MFDLRMPWKRSASGGVLKVSTHGWFCRWFYRRHSSSRFTVIVQENSGNSVKHFYGTIRDETQNVWVIFELNQVRKHYNMWPFAWRLADAVFPFGRVVQVETEENIWHLQLLLWCSAGISLLSVWFIILRTTQSFKSSFLICCLKSGSSVRLRNSIHVLDSQVDLPTLGGEKGLWAQLQVFLCPRLVLL